MCLAEWRWTRSRTTDQIKLLLIRSSRDEIQMRKPSPTPWQQSSQSLSFCPGFLLSRDLRYVSAGPVAGSHSLEIWLYKKSCQETTDRLLTMHKPSKRVVAERLICFHNINFALTCNFHCECHVANGLILKIVFTCCSVDDAHIFRYILTSYSTVQYHHILYSGIQDHS